VITALRKGFEVGRCEDGGTIGGIAQRGLKRTKGLLEKKGGVSLRETGIRIMIRYIEEPTERLDSTAKKGSRKKRLQITCAEHVLKKQLIRRSEKEGNRPQRFTLWDPETGDLYLLVGEKGRVENTKDD